ncbi:hypothetical protein LAWI1_G000174 [Lachnellula willkommii]|uniref:Uncharacterized protein n=1 Tax=Lachnellula willkommii TaxID=215461 RepID=A0A559MMM5_9HELO|nr:hypothetical protein LAWI1_G000174 [Lachnellula willkommii]
MQPVLSPVSVVLNFTIKHIQYWSPLLKLTILLRHLSPVKASQELAL